MTLLARGGWTLCAAFFLLLTSSLVHLPHVGFVPIALVTFVLAVSIWRPASGVEILAALIPVSGELLGRYWNSYVGWAEVFACAGIAGLSIDAARRRGPGRVPFTIGAPGLLFGLAVTASIAAGLGVRSLTLGPDFAPDLAHHLSSAYFVETAAYPGLHAGFLLLEGILLIALVSRLLNEKPARLQRIAGAVAVGAALAGMLNIARLMEGALRSDAVLSAIVNLAHARRWNVEYTDYNAAGSYFVMALCLAGVLLVVAGTRKRWWAVSASTILIALWLTGSRTAYAAGVLAIAAAWTLRHAKGRRRIAAAAGIALGATTLVALIAFASPERAEQRSSRIAADIRFQMAKVGARVMAANPAFGIGVGEFYQHGGDYANGELFNLFPLAHENAHNNFIQIAAELGLVGCIPFIWLVAAGLLASAREARRRDEAGDASSLLIFAGLSAFVITWLAGHPLLTPEPAYLFWIVFGASVGAAESARATPPRLASRRLVAIAAAAIAIAAPLHARTEMDDAELEHVGFGLSEHWMLSPDGIRYRAATGHGAVFVPSDSALTFSVNPRTDRPVRLEVRLEGRVADVITLAPGQWKDVTLPKRSDRKASRFVPMDFHVLDGDRIEIWLTKVRPVASR